jgi:glyoxylase-like metal-dependent hydrolase (beta-lactamase superfamily II)
VSVAVFAAAKPGSPPKSTPPAKSEPEPAASPRTPQKLAEGAWAMMTKGGANAGWFTFGDSVIAVDAGRSADDANAILAAIAETAGKRPVSYLILTNDFGPHAGGAEVFARRGATVVCHENFVGVVQALVARSAKPEKPGSKAAGATAAVFGIASRLVLASPTRHVIVRHLGPADSAGDLAVLLAEDKVLFSGDLVESYLLPPLFSKDIDLQGWQSALTLLSNLNAKVVVPGYGPIGPTAAIAATREYLARALAAAETILRDQTPDGFIATRIEEADLKIEGLPDELKKAHEANVKALVARLKSKSTAPKS